MPADWTIKQGDTQPVFVDTLNYGDGTVPPLRGATLDFQLRSLTSASLAPLTGVAQITNPNTGDVLFPPSAADTATAGNYFAEWVVTFDPSTGLGQQTFPTGGYSWVSIEPNLTLLPQLVVDIPSMKRYLNIQGNDHTRDADLIDLVETVTPLIEAEVGPIVPKVYEEWFDGGSPVIELTYDPSEGFGSNPFIQLIGASEYRGSIEYPLALIASPALGSTYSVMLVSHQAMITRRTAGGQAIAFAPGHESLHVWYQAGQNPIPKVIQRAAMEYVRTLYRWPQQTGTGSLSPADRMEAGMVLSQELSRIVKMYTRPLRRYPSIG